ncbi:hypothetical protein GT748_04235 [Bittarella massiliensis]|uniref:Bacteriophage Gp15 protein n=1 Tax=Bittarella massiliensis (ex Durand et al. 2017) TaxID=1720313 RepID=A0ABW9WVA6_9FIRM|nr:hypothetical protein [Bittarella massiliensis (ex Durand et al. 2017)]MZL79846.1 hypothetical protein [Bittarella massiliensis (ex Durand et al. 2017)]
MERSRRKWRSDFKTAERHRETGWYDPEYDRILIEQSIAKQYGVLPSQQEELSYSDWYKMVGGLMGDTPLGQVIELRSEKDKERLKHFSPAQRRIRAEWAHFVGRKKNCPEQEAAQQQQLASLQMALAEMFKPQ